MILDFLVNYAWIVWLAIILIFGIIELTTLDFTFLMLATGSLGGLVSGLLGAPWWLQIIIAGVVTDVCVAFPTLCALAEGFEVFVVTDASGTFNETVQQAAWARMTAAGAQLVNWFSVACELQVDWRNDMEGLANLLSPRIPNYRNLMNSYSALTAK
jgi:hypothetical protein